MREHKYKVWDKELQIMGIVVKLESVIPDDDLFDEVHYVDDAGIENKAAISDCILLQYTGLKDKNDKSIYEGDVCIVNLKYFNIKNEKALVIFKDGAFQFQYGCEEYFSKPYGAWNDVKVIGNIYENPELKTK